MYEQMTRDELLAQLRLADEEIGRLLDKNTQLANDYDDAKRDAEHWHGMYLDQENKAVSEESRLRRAEQRRLAEWNTWAQHSAQATS